MREIRLLVVIMLTMTILLHAYPIVPVKGANIPPTPSFTYSPEFPQPYELVTFDASQSHDSDGSIVRYEWVFGDGYIVNVTYPIVQHSYYEDGTYQVILTVVDNQGGRGLTYLNIIVNCNAWFRVVDSSGNPIGNVTVTMYYATSKSSSTWHVAPASYSGLEILYDYVTQPDLANTNGEKYRNPGTTASILRSSASNTGFEIHQSDWYVFFKFEWGSNVVYWPNETKRVLSYDNGYIETNYYSNYHKAVWNSYANTYVTKSSYIPSDGVNPKSYYPIIVGFQGIPALSVSISPSSATLDVGQSQTFTSTVLGGTTPYSYQWYLNNNPVSGATSPTWTFIPTSAGSYTVYLNVTDCTMTRKKSNVASVIVNPALSVSILPASVVLDVGQSRLFTSSVSGGTSPYSYQWYLNGAVVSGATSPSWTFTPSSVGSYTVYVNATDCVGLRAKSNIASVTVNAALSVSISPASVVLDVGQSRLFTSSVSGGTSPYSYQWYLNGAVVSGATSATWTFTPTSAGSYTIYLKVTDTASATATSNTALVTVNGALSVSITPDSATLDVGQSQLFTSSVSGGTSPYMYQWYLNGAAVSGATSSTWTFAPSSAGSYTVYVNVTDSVSCKAESNTATVTVNAALSVSISPGSAMLDVGQSQIFSSSVSGGTSPYSYQWYLNGAPVSGATNPTWTFTPASAGSYTVYVKITDNVGMQATSNTVPATVNGQLSVTIAPTSVVLDVGQSRLFTSSVSGGTPPYTYQWYLNGAPVSGATNPTWTFTPASSGSYTVYLKVTDNVGVSADSPTSNVTVNPQLTVSISPGSATIYLGQSQTFTSSVSGGASPYSYQWYLDGSPVSGATNPTWTFTPSSTGTYQVYLKITDAVNLVAQSSTSQLTVNSPPAFTVTISSSSAVIDVGQSVSFTSSVTGGTTPFTYQWYLDGSAISGATSPTWTFTPTSAGSYQVYLNVTDSLNIKGKSNTATVTVNLLPTIIISPTSPTIDLGQSKTFTSSVSGGTSPFSYQWYLNGSPVSGATNPTWTFTPSTTGNYQIYVEVADNVGESTDSNTANLAVNSVLSVTISPASVVLDVGQSQLFTSTVLGGTSPYSYQWYLDSAPVSGATNPTWIFVPSSPGSYAIYVIVTDSADVDPSAQSPPAQVIVNSSPTITITPASVVLDVGQSQLFSSSVSGGTSPYSYQWYLNGVAVSGATGVTWTFAPASAGSYTVYANVTDSVGIIAKSNIASVTVNPPLSVSITPSSVVLDVGQSQLFTSSVSGGTSPYSYQWYLNNTLVLGATSAPWTFMPCCPGVYNIHVNVTDSAGFAAKSNIAMVTVHGAPSVSISPASATLDVGQSQLFTSSVSGGTSPHTYQWYLNGAPVSGATGATWTFTPSSAGSYTVYLIITDSVGMQVTSNTASITVNGLPTVSILPTSATIHVGDTVVFTSTVLGGTSPYSYQWYLNGAAVPGATLSIWTFSQPAGSYTIYLNVTDSVGMTAKSNVASITVLIVLAVTINPPSATIILGNSVPFILDVIGGVEPYYYQWYINGNPVSGATNPDWTFTPTSVGTYNAQLNVTDSIGLQVRSNIVSVVVKQTTSVGGLAVSINAPQFFDPWLSLTSLLAAAVFLKGIVAKKKRS